MTTNWLHQNPTPWDLVSSLDSSYNPGVKETSTKLRELSSPKGISEQVRPLWLWTEKNRIPIYCPIDHTKVWPTPSRVVSRSTGRKHEFEKGWGRQTTWTTGVRTSIRSEVVYPVRTEMTTEVMSYKTPLLRRWDTKYVIVPSVRG